MLRYILLVCITADINIYLDQGKGEGVMLRYRQSMPVSTRSVILNWNITMYLGNANTLNLFHDSGLPTSMKV